MVVKSKYSNITVILEVYKILNNIKITQILYNKNFKMKYLGEYCTYENNINIKIFILTRQVQDYQNLSLVLKIAKFEIKKLI